MTDHRDYKLRPFGQDAKVSREFYDQLIAMTDWDQAAPSEELTKTQDLSRWGWCKVHDGSFQPGGTADRVRQVQTGVCGSCDHALDMWRMRNDPETVRIKGQHYRLGNELAGELDPKMSLSVLVEKLRKDHPTKWGLGMGGQMYVIRFNDGRTVITNNLWHQGDITPVVGHLLPDNAVFVEV